MESTQPSPEYQITVDAQRIKFADAQITCEHFFRNARVTLNKEEMQTLRQHIRKFGLLHPITVRPCQNDPNYEYECVLGSRRLRSIQFFLDQDTIEPFLVFNKKTGKSERASEVYGGNRFPVNVRNCNDEEAITLSIGENLERSQLDEIDLMEFCKELALLTNSVGNPKFTREQIGRMCSRSESWVSLTLKLEQLPEHAKDFMRSGRLTRTAALSLLQTNSDKLKDVLNYAEGLVKQEAIKEESEALKELEEAKDELELAETDAAVASIRANQTAMQKTNKRVGRAKKRVSMASEKRNNAQKKTKEGQLTQDHINTANVMVEGAKKGAPKSLPMKTVREKLEEFEDFVNLHASATSETDKKIHTAVTYVIEWVLGKRVSVDIYSLLQSMNGQVG